MALGSPQHQTIEQEMTHLAAKIFGADAALGALSNLHFEACSLLMADMKRQVTSVDASDLRRKLPFVKGVKACISEDQAHRVVG